MSTQFLFANNTLTTLSAAITSSGQTTITLASTVNAPSPTGGQVWAITLCDAATRSNFEILYCTARTGAVCTVLRGQEGTAATTWLVNDFVYGSETAGILSNFALINGSSSQNFATAGLSINGSITGVTNGSFSGFIAANGSVTGGGASVGTAGDIGAARGVSTGAYFFGTSPTTGAILDYGIATTGWLSFRNNIGTYEGFHAGSLAAGTAPYLGATGTISTGLTSTTGQLVFGGSGASTTGAGAIYFDGTNYNFYSVNLGGSTANITASSGAYQQTSDARLKENVADLSLGLDVLLKLRPVSFDWIASKEAGQGFLAQDVQQQVPLAVNVINDETGILGLSDALLTPVVVKAIQELTAEFRAYVATTPRTQP